MALRPAKCFRRNDRPWTRTAKNKPDRAYVAGVPDSKVRMFEMGVKNGQYDIQADLIAKQMIQIRDNAFEAARVIANKHLESRIPGAYFFKVRKFPHQCLREHKMLTGAGADRLSKGMSLAFGRPVGRAVYADRDDILVTVLTFKKNEDVVRAALKKASSKLPCDCLIKIGKIGF